MVSLANRKTFSDFPKEKSFNLLVDSTGIVMIRAGVGEKAFIAGFAYRHCLLDFHLLLERFGQIQLVSCGRSRISIDTSERTGQEGGDTSGLRSIIHSTEILSRQVELLLISRPEKRYDRFMSYYDDCAGLIPMGAVSSYIGISIQSLSRIRKRKCRRGVVAAA
ncbi:MAG TPA: hypothetical protein VFR58_08785 [Flavisolibacter sp.]|nr:hypothetical protein [Flavisolibacter sp.]